MLFLNYGVLILQNFKKVVKNFGLIMLKDHFTLQFLYSLTIMYFVVKLSRICKIYAQTFVFKKYKIVALYLIRYKMQLVVILTVTNYFCSIESRVEIQTKELSQLQRLVSRKKCISFQIHTLQRPKRFLKENYKINFNVQIAMILYQNSGSSNQQRFPIGT